LGGSVTALIEGQLYKKGVSKPMLKCVTETEGVQILREVHSGTCGSHAGPRALAAKVIRQGFYWPAMICAANRVTRSCEACQKFSPRSGSLTIHKANRPHVASSAPGPGHCRAPTHGPGEPQVHLRRRRVFYQMDQGEGCIHDNIEDCPEVLLAKHCLPLRSPVRAHS
jgi:hypothetical protein